MDEIIQTMLAKYNPQNNIERENAIKEIIQEIALSGLARGDFFEKVAFYGGSCLRIFYGLNRFSEDLDFALIKKDESFNISDYFPYLEKEFLSYGLELKIEMKQKRDDFKVQSAFLKTNTMEMLMNLFPNSDEIKKVIPNQILKVKFEIDVDNPDGGNTEYKYRFFPSPYEVQVFDEETLFAGKIHAILCREHKNNVKGRDYYDYLFYVGKGSKINLQYLENKLKNSGKIDANEILTLDIIKEMLKDKFNNTDFELAKIDVERFITNKDSLRLWNKDLFIASLDSLR